MTEQHPAQTTLSQLYTHFNLHLAAEPTSKERTHCKGCSRTQMPSRCMHDTKASAPFPASACSWPAHNALNSSTEGWASLLKHAKPSISSATFPSKGTSRAAYISLVKITLPKGNALQVSPTSDASNHQKGKCGEGPVVSTNGCLCL